MAERSFAEYREYQPDPRLAPQIVCLWTQKVIGDAPYQHPVLPDACVDMVFVGERAIVAGPATLPVLAELPPGAALLGVRFRPGAAPSWLGAAAHELLNLDVPLHDIWGPEADVLGERLAVAPSPAARRELLEEVLLARLENTREVDRVVDAAIAALAHPGAPDIRGLSRDLFLSERQLLRRFRERVGYGPKTLQRILRLQRFLLVTEGGTKSLAGSAHAAGYADQAHMTREIRELTGESPQALVRRSAGTLGMSDLFNPEPRALR